MTAEEIENEIKNGTFDWKRDSHIIASDFSELFEPELYNWEIESWAVAKFCPQHFDVDRYNWTHDSWAIAEYCPEHFDAKRYNWEDKIAVNLLRTKLPHLLLKDLSIV